MFGHYLDLAARQLQRSPWLTLLMVVLTGVGVAATMTTLAALRAISGDPVPGKSAQLFVPQIDNQGPQAGWAKGEPPPSLSYIDAMALLRSNGARHTTLTAPLTTAVIPDDPNQAPIAVRGYATTADFFTMFNVPFRYGSGWSDAASDGNVAVIGAQLDRKLFGGGNSVGRFVNIGGHSFRIVGVLDDWNPQPRFYAGADVNAIADRREPTQLFIPFARALALQTIGHDGSVMCPPSYHGAGWSTLLASGCDWISAWVELPTTADVARYRTFLEDYAAEQQQLGRFNWAPNVQLRDLHDWLEHMHAVPQANRIAVVLAIGLQAVCLLNTLALLLARFMRRQGEVGIRRALGASQRTIVMQFLIEAALVGATGGVIGIMLTTIGVHRIGDLFGDRMAGLVRIDGRLFALTLGVAVATLLVVGILPAWRAAGVPPSRQLKSQ